MALLIKRLTATFRTRRPYLTNAVLLDGRRALLAALFLLLGNATAETGAPTEYEIKAAFIHNIAKFVEWPVTSGGETGLTLCILGQNPFGNAVGALQGKRVGSMAWTISFPNSQTNLKECRVLFIAASESGNLKRILERLHDSAVLTLGDSDGYAERGVMVNFYLADNKVRFEINSEATRRANLKIGSQVLKLARKVQEEEK